MQEDFFDAPYIRHRGHYSSRQLADPPAFNLGRNLAFRALSYVDKDFNLQKEFDKIRTFASKACLSKSKDDNILIDKQKKISNKSDISNCVNNVNTEDSDSKKYVLLPILILSLQTM